MNQHRFLSGRRPTQQGFTLIEVLVALVVAAVALAALSRVLGLSAMNQGALENKVVATWVAQDALLQKQLFSTAQLPKSVESMGRAWNLQVETTPSLVPNFQQIRIAVASPELTQKQAVNASVASIMKTDQ